MARTLVTQSEYARMRGVSKVAVHKRTAPRGGPIPLYGPKKLIDVAEADTLWKATISAKNIASSRFSIPATEEGSVAAPSPEAVRSAQATVVATIAETGEVPPAVAAAATPAAQAKIASAIIKAQTDKINLERLKGSLIDKTRALRLAFGFSRRNRDAWLNWPARIGPEVAAALDVDPHVLTTLLERHVREHLTELADQPLDLG